MEIKFGSALARWPSSSPPPCFSSQPSSNGIRCGTVRGVSTEQLTRNRFFFVFGGDAATMEIRCRVYALCMAYDETERNLCTSNAFGLPFFGTIARASYAHTHAEGLNHNQPAQRKRRKRKVTKNFQFKFNLSPKKSPQNNTRNYC